MSDSRAMHTWQGQHLGVKVLHSFAGVAQQIAVSCNEGTLLFDAGDGVLRDLLDNDISLRSIAAVFITHGHFDHMGGLHSLLGCMRMIERSDRLPIHIPEGCTEVKEVVDGFLRCYGGSMPFDLSCREVRPGEIIAFAGMEVIGYAVTHCGSVGKGTILPQIPAVGYRIACQGEEVAVTGDTGNCPGLKDLVTGVDLAVIEATFPAGAAPSPEMIECVHLSEDIAHQVGALAKEHILVHKIRKR